MKRQPSVRSVTQRRAMRRYQARHRGSAQSYVTRYEDAVIVLAWVEGLLSEGQAAKALGLDRLDARARRDWLIADGAVIGAELWQATKTKASAGERER
jgi:hypothetical protein